MASRGYRIAVVGATTPVGKEIVKTLEDRGFPAVEIVPLEAKGSLGGSVEFLGQEIPTKTLEDKMFRGIDISFFASGPRASIEYVRAAVREGSLAIDTTVAFRMDRTVPLVIPEINPQVLSSHQGIIASPAPGAIQMALPLVPIHRKARIRRIIATTFQAVSDAGEAAMNELTEQITGLFNFREAECSVFLHQIAFNAIPQVGTFLDNGYTSEEMDVMLEMKRILGEDELKISATTVHIPVFFSNSQSLTIETEQKLTPDEVRSILKDVRGVSVEDKPASGVYPLAVYATGKDECFVGRIREDLSVENGIALWTAMDNVRKGAALNAVQIAEHLTAGK